MTENRCHHDFLPGQCAICRPPPAGMPAVVFRTRGGSTFHRTSSCAGLRDGQRYAEHLGMEIHPIEPVPLVEIRDRLGACEVCFPAGRPQRCPVP